MNNADRLSFFRRKDGNWQCHDRWFHVLTTGEHPEAMKDGKNASGPTQANNCWSCTLALLMLVLINSSAQRLSVVGTRPASTWT